MLGCLAWKLHCPQVFRWSIAEGHNGARICNALRSVSAEEENQEPQLRLCIKLDDMLAPKK